MENWGLIVYQDPFMLFNKESDTQENELTGYS